MDDFEEESFKTKTNLIFYRIQAGHFAQLYFAFINEIIQPEDIMDA